jgi:flagellar hook assembly protein FlgD
MGAYGGGDSVIVGIELEENQLPDRLVLSQNYPNPFNGSTTIRYSLPEPSYVTIEIYDILGLKVETLVQGIQPAGRHQIVWDAGDASSGVYFYKIMTPGHSEAKRMILIK